MQAYRNGEGNHMSEQGQAFVVMQVGPKESAERKRADEIYDYVIRPALAKFSVKAYRADQDFTPGAITPKMLTELLESRLVIADLTGRNPNVFYELGITHSFARPLISIADSAGNLPFDAKDERVIEMGVYPDTGLAYAQGEEAKKALIASLEIVLADGFVPPSPLREIAGSQSLDALAPENPLASEIGQIRETLEEIKGALRPRAIVPRGVREDMSALKDAIEAVIRSGDLDPDVIRPHLVTQTTTPDHDRWADSTLYDLAPKAADQAAEDPWGSPAPANPVEDPWATPAPAERPPWERNGEEPPF